MRNEIKPVREFSFSFGFIRHERSAIENSHNSHQIAKAMERQLGE